MSCCGIKVNGEELFENGVCLPSDTTYVPEQCNDEKLKKVLKVNDFRHFFLDFIIVTYYN